MAYKFAPTFHLLSPCMLELVQLSVTASGNLLRFLTTEPL